MARPFRPRDAKPDPRRDVSDELRFHLDMRAEEFAARGLPPDDARRAAEASFGDVAAVRAECERVRTDRERARRWRAWRWDLRMDARYALRALRRSPLFTLGAVLTLALGVGAAAAVFTLVNGVLLRPLPYPDADRLAMVWADPGEGGDVRWPLSASTYLDVRSEARAFASMAALRGTRYTLGGVGDAAPEMVAGARVDPALFATLGVRPVLGRGFTPDEAREGAARVAVLSDALWRRRFGGDRAVVGRAVTLSGERHTVVGVMPAGFAFPRGAELPAPLQFGTRTEVWTPLVFSARDRTQPGAENLTVVARLRAGETLATADAALDRIARRLRAEHPQSFGSRMGFRAMSVAEQAAAPVRRGLLLLMAAVGFVLLIACANVANLLVARAAHRAREFATRRALGATRGRIFLQLVVENAVLTLVGAALGLAGAATAGRALLRALPSELPRADDVAVDATVVGATVLAALAVGIVFAAATAATVGGHGTAAGAIGARATAGPRRRAGRRLLVAAEIALSLVLLTGAGLLTRSFARLQAVEPGFDTRGTMTAGVLAPVGGGFDQRRDGPRWNALFTGYAARLAAQPGTAAAGGVSGLPLTGAVEYTGLQLPGRVVAEGEPAPSALYNVVVGAYFETMRIPLRAGRLFDARDAAGAVGPARALVVSEALVRRHFAGVSLADVVGRPLGLGIGGGEPHTIVGVVGDVRQGALDASPVPTVYLPIAQHPYPAMSMVVRTTSGGAAAAVPRMRDALAAIDPTLALHDVRPLAEVVAASIARQRFALGLAGAFAAVALVLCAVGLYAVIATSVAQRTRELGVRLALGATPAAVRRLVLREGMRVTALGVALGTAGALGAARLLRAQLFEVSALDPLVYGGVALLTAGVALAATWLPARRATAVDPVAAIHGD